MRVEDELESVQISAIARADVTQNLLAFVTDDNANFLNAGGEKTIDLVIQNGLAVRGNQTLWPFSMHRTDSSATACCKN
jgi:hypothetical protein